MKHRLLPVGVLAIVALIQACSSDTTVVGNNSDDQRPLNARPSSSTELDVFANSIARAQVSPGQASSSQNNLFSNSGFENGLANWTACEPGAISVSSDAQTGSNALELAAGNCFYRTIEATPGQSYSLSCNVKLTNVRAWTGMGLSFSDNNFNKLEESPIAVATAGEYIRLDTAAAAPSGTTQLSMWVHSDHGALVDNCRLVPAQIEIPASDADNLLSNGDFQSLSANGDAKYWSAGCAGSVTANGNGLTLSDRACVDQALGSAEVNTITGKDSTFSCLINDVTGYADLSVYLNNELQGFRAISPDDINQRVEVNIDAVNAQNGFVTIYADQHLSVADCNFSSDENNSNGPLSPSTPTETSARYRLTFNGEWTVDSHPLNFPPPAHFSGLVGAVHGDDVSFWGPGQIATDGIELMAETGDGSLLLEEVAVAVGNGTALTQIAGGGIAVSPGSVSIEFEVTQQHPTITVTSMLAPSPDWFIGVHGLNLFDGTRFVDSLTLPMAVYDAGTDNGVLFINADEDTNPAAPISLLTSEPADTDLLNGLPVVGEFVIQKLP